MKDTLLYIVKAIVEKSDAVSIEEVEENGIITFLITVDPSDMGKIIGKEGKVIRALRNVMKIPAIKEQKKIQVSLSE